MDRAQWVPLDCLLSGCLELRRPKTERTLQNENEDLENVDRLENEDHLLRKINPNTSFGQVMWKPPNKFYESGTEYANKIRLNHFVCCAPRWALFATTFSAFGGPALLFLLREGYGYA